MYFDAPVLPNLTCAIVRLHKVRVFFLKKKKRNMLNSIIKIIYVFIQDNSIDYIPKVETDELTQRQQIIAKVIFLFLFLKQY